MTNVGRNYNFYMVVSCLKRLDNDVMNTPPNSAQHRNHPNSLAALRAAYGPGFQHGGPTDAVLRTVIGQNRR